MRKGFVAFVMIGSVLVLLAIGSILSLSTLYRASRSAQDRLYSKAFEQLVEAMASYTREAASSFDSRMKEAFPRTLAELAIIGRLNSSVFAVCLDNTVCDSTLYYRSSPILYFKTPMAESGACSIAVDSSGRVYSAAALVVFQGPKYLSRPLSDPFYSDLERMIEQPNQRVITLQDVQDYYRNRSEVGSIYSDDMLYFVTIQSEAERYKSEIASRSVAFAQLYYSKFRDRFTQWAGMISPDPALALQKVLSDQELALSLCNVFLEDLFRPNQRVDSGEVFIGQCVDSSGADMTPLAYLSDRLEQFELLDLNGSPFCLRARCVFVDDSGRLTVEIDDPQLVWPVNQPQPNFSNSKFVSFDLRVDIDWDHISTDSSVSCPFRLP